MPIVTKLDCQIIEQDTIAFVYRLFSKNGLHSFDHDFSIQQIGKAGNELKQFFLLKVLLMKRLNPLSTIFGRYQFNLTVGLITKRKS